jgi:hypothetical protein
MIYREKLHPAVAEIAIHVQSFLGCDSALFCEDLASAAVPTEAFTGEQTSDKDLKPPPPTTHQQTKHVV